MIMTLRVHLLDEPAAKDLRTLLSRLDSDISLSTGSEFPPPDADGIDILVAGRPQREQLSASPSLSRLIIPWAGVPPATRQLLLDFPHIAVHNLHHNAAPTAELAIALLLAAAKFIVPFDRSLRENDWRLRYQPNPSMLLAGKTVLILGYGHIGRRVGEFCRALGMIVLGIRRHPDQDDMDPEVQVHGLQSLPDLLLRSQVLVITLPATQATEGLIGEDALKRMPPGGILVNVGRGSIVDQDALYRALQSGHLRAAGLDVWYHYPDGPLERQNTPPADLPFGELVNVVMSPHRGGASSETEELRMQHLAELLNAVARGKPVPNRVDLEAGY
jgi:phosphoglycerate dehydrogenase-like enzyme